MTAEEVWGKICSLPGAPEVYIHVIAAALKQCRNEAIEEVIVVCEKEIDRTENPDSWSASIIGDLKDKVRALKEK